MTVTSTSTSTAAVSVAERVVYSDGLRWERVLLHIATTAAVQLVDLTDHIATAVAGAGLRSGWVAVTCRHTSCGVMVNEYESGLCRDVRTLCRELVECHPSRLWEHDNLEVRTENLVDGERPNAHSHLLTMLFSQPVLHVTVEAGRLDLGRWQRVLLAEFDGPRPDPDVPPGREPVHPIRQVVLDICSFTGHRIPTNAAGA